MHLRWYLALCIILMTGCSSSSKVVESSANSEISANNEDGNGQTDIMNTFLPPLHAACDQSKIDKKLIQKLVSEGADINEYAYIDKNKHILMTPLMIACNRSDIDIEAINLLIELGANVNLFSDDTTYQQRRYSPMMLAVNRSKISIEAIHVLHDAGYHINNSVHGMTALMVACDRSEIDDEAIKTLIELGADVNKTNYDHSNAAIIAANRVNADIEAINILLPYVTDINAPNDEGINLISTTGAVGSLDLTQKLFSMGADIQYINTKENYGQNLLETAAAVGSKEVVQYYLNHGLDVNHKRQDGQSALMLAFWGNTLDVVKLLVEAGADTKLKADGGLTMLDSACSKKPEGILIDRAQLDVIQYLLSLGAEINEEEIDGETALHYLAKNRKDVSDVLKYMLSKGADINHTTKKGITPLMYVKNPDVARTMIKEGANINAQDKHGENALFHAISNDELDVAQVLIDAGIDKHAKSASGYDVRSDASTAKSLEFLYKNGFKFNDMFTQANKFPLKAANFFDYDYIYNSPNRDRLLALLKVGAGSDNPNIENEILDYFCTHSDTLISDEIMDELIRRKPDILEESGTDCISNAFYKNSIETVGVLKRHGVKLPSKIQPFYQLFRREDPYSTEMVKALIQAGADINLSVDPFDGYKVIIRGIRREPVYRQNVPVLNLIVEKTPDAVKDALDAGANPNVTDPDGKTPLMMAKNAEAVKLLIKSGANIEARTKDNQTALMIHALYGTPDVVKTLLDAGAKIDEKDLNYIINNTKADDRDHIYTSVNLSIIKNHVNGKRYPIADLFIFRDYTEQMLKNAIDNGGDINQKDDRDRTLLHYACQDDEAKVKLLLKYGADPNIAENRGDGIDSGYTPLIFAVDRSTPKIGIIMALLQAGADVNLKTNRGVSPLQKSVYRENIQITKLLLDHGADVNSVNAFGETPLFSICMASKDERVQLLKLLLEHGANPNIKNIDGKTVLMAMLHANFSDDSSDDEFSDDDFFDDDFFYCGNPELYKVLIEGGADINAVDNNGRNVLFYAANANNPALVKYLISAGVNTKAKDKHGKTVIESLKPGSSSKKIINIIKSYKNK